MRSSPEEKAAPAGEPTDHLEDSFGALGPVSMARLGELIGLSATSENPRVDARATARSRSGGRAAVGAACFAAPELTTRPVPWIACGAACDAVDLTPTLLELLCRAAPPCWWTR